MANRDRPHREQKKKPKEKDASKGVSHIQPLLEPPTNVELIKPKRKPRWEENEEA